MRWAGAADLRFAAHIAIVPHCGWIPRELATTGSPILFLLAELDDQSPPDDCVRHADRLRKAGNPDVAVHLYKGVHHGWEVLGAVPHFDRRAENFAKCRAILDEDGTSTAPDGTLVPANKSRAWAEATCITLGGWCCGGNEAHKTRATGDVVDFLRKHGF